MPRSPDFPRRKTISDIFQDIRKPDTGPDTAWYKVGPSEPHGINFTNSWLNVTSSTLPNCSWYHNDDGEVRMRGRITGGAVGSVVTVLPPEIRPEYSCYFPVESETDDHYDLANIRFRAYDIASLSTAG